MKLELLQTPSSIIYASDLKTGQIGVINGTTPHTVLRHEKGLVCLDDPTIAWSNPLPPLIIDKVYAHGTTFRLTT